MKTNILIALAALALVFMADASFASDSCYDNHALCAPTTTTVSVPETTVPVEVEVPTETQLPRTGSELVWLVQLGIVCVFVGGALAIKGRNG